MARRGLVGCLAGLALIFAAGAGSDTAAAAVCSGPSFTLDAGDIAIAGTSCGEESEDFGVFCDGAGKVAVTYVVNNSNAGTFSSAYACSTPTRLTIDGYIGGDSADLSRVSAANGFTSINRPNNLYGSFGNDLLIAGPLPANAVGGPGSDMLLLRNGTADTGDCGEGLDFAQTDRPGTDTLGACEIVDLAPPPAAAKKKCKKKKGTAKTAKKKRCRNKKR